MPTRPLFCFLALLLACGQGCIATGPSLAERGVAPLRPSIPISIELRGTTKNLFFNRSPSAGKVQLLGLVKEELFYGLGLKEEAGAPLEAYVDLNYEGMSTGQAVLAGATLLLIPVWDNNKVTATVTLKQGGATHAFSAESGFFQLWHALFLLTAPFSSIQSREDDMARDAGRQLVLQILAHPEASSWLGDLQN